MQYVAVSKNVKISPRKVRLVVDRIKKFELAKALIVLSQVRKRAALPIRKTMESAIANAAVNFKVKKDDLRIGDIIVQEGIVYKRFHYAARGRISPYKKRASHIKVILENKIKNQIANIKNKDEK